MAECIITRSSLINRCNHDGKLHYMFTENERPCKEAYLKEIHGGIIWKKQKLI